MITAFCIGLALGIIVGWTWGITAENKLWLDAVCGREKIMRAGKLPPRDTEAKL